MSGTDSVLVSEVIPASRERIYTAWLDSDQHSAFTGDSADIEPVVGGSHTTFGGYANGKNVDLQPPSRIVQTWRSREFPEGTPDSRLEVTLEETVGGTLVTVLHTEIPTGYAERYREAWLKFYLEPMKRYFGENRPNGVASTVAPAFAGTPEVTHDSSEDKTSPGIRLPDPGAAMGVVAASKVRARTARPRVKAKARPKPKARSKPKTRPKPKAPPRAKGNAKRKAKAKASPKRKATAKTRSAKRAKPPVARKADKARPTRRAAAKKRKR